jgi:hypothetical protein
MPGACEGSKKLRLAFDLYEAGEEMMRSSLRRRHPSASPAAIERMLAEWLSQRPGAEHGDCPGRRIPAP